MTDALPTNAIRRWSQYFARLHRQRNSSAHLFEWWSTRYSFHH